MIDAKILLSDPERILALKCEKIQIPFYPVMLKWDRGPRQEDGIWAKYWYHKVHESTGFSQNKERKEDIPENLNSLLHEGRPYYQNLRHFAIE